MSDINKLKAAGLYTLTAAIQCPRKVTFLTYSDICAASTKTTLLQVLTEIRGLSEAKVIKIHESVNKVLTHEHG